jgi:outer membrane protein assembly factor BamA
VTGFVEVCEVGGRRLFIDAGSVYGMSCPGLPETTASKEDPLCVMIRGGAPINVVAISPLHLMAKVKFARQHSRDDPLYVYWHDGKIMAVETRWVDG